MFSSHHHEESRRRERTEEASQTLLPRSSWCPAVVLVNPTMLFNITVDHEPLGCASFKLLADKVPKTAENVLVLTTGEK